MLIMLAYKTNRSRICKNNIEAEQEISRCDIIRDISFNFIARLMGSLDMKKSIISSQWDFGALSQSLFLWPSYLRCNREAVINYKSDDIKFVLFSLKVMPYDTELFLTKIILIAMK